MPDNRHADESVAVDAGTSSEIRPTRDRWCSHAQPTNRQNYRSAPSILERSFCVTSASETKTGVELIEKPW
jgi:hypothetical protein